MKTRRSFFQIGALLGFLVPRSARAKTNTQRTHKSYEFPLNISEGDIKVSTWNGTVLTPLLFEVIFRKLGNFTPGGISSETKSVLTNSGRAQRERLSFKVNPVSGGNKTLVLEVYRPDYSEQTFISNEYSARLTLKERSNESFISTASCWCKEGKARSPGILWSPGTPGEDTPLEIFTLHSVYMEVSKILVKNKVSLA